MRSQQTGMPQPHSWQQSGFNDVQLLQQHIMFKKLQELHRQQQLQQFGDVKQQNSINQFSANAKQAVRGQFPPLISGSPIHDTSQMFMNWAQNGAPPAAQGVPNGQMFAQQQALALRSMGQASQQLDASLYGTPVANARGNLSQFSQFQGISDDRPNVLTQASGDQTQKPTMQSLAFSNSFLGDHCAGSSKEDCLTTGGTASKQRVQGKSMHAQDPNQSLNSENLLENPQHTLQEGASVQEFNGRHEPAGWPVPIQGKEVQISPTQGLATLDPLEEKILFNMDDNIWGSFGTHTEPSTGNFGDTPENINCSNVFPSIQSGSWSALMQSAVAESSSDTGLQEEWSGLTFQNIELSADNQPSNFIDSGKQQSGCVDTSLQCASSSSSKPFSMYNDSIMSSSFPGFQHSSIHFSSEQREGLRPDSPREAIQQSPKNAGNWLDCDTQKMPHVEGREHAHQLARLENAWTSNSYEQSESDAPQQSISSHDQQPNKPNGRSYESPTPSGNAKSHIRNDGSIVDNCWTGDINVSMYKDRDPDECAWRFDNRGERSFPNSMGGLAQLQTGTNTTLVDREDSKMKRSAAVPIVSTIKADQESGHQHIHQHGYMIRSDVSVEHKGVESMGNGQHQLGNGPHNGADEAYEKLQNCYQRENSNESNKSIASQHKITEQDVRENVRSNASDSQLVGGRYKNSSGQISRGLSSWEQGSFGQSKLISNVSNSSMNMEKGHFHEIQGNSKASEDVPSRSNLGFTMSASLDRSAGFCGPNITAQTSQNMPKFLQKVDQSRENSSVTPVGFTVCNPLSHTEVPESYGAHMYNHASASQGFGLRLAPPSEWQPNSNRIFPFQSSPQMVSYPKSRHVNLDEGEKGQTWLAPPSSVQNLLPLHESSQREHWEERDGILRQTDIRTSHSNTMEISPAASTSGPSFFGSQFHGQHMSNAPVAIQSSQATLPSTAGRLPPFNLSFSQETSGPMRVNPFGQHSPVLESVPVTQPLGVSGMSRQREFSMRPPSVWTNVSSSRLLPGAEFHKVPSTNLSNNSLETTSWAPQKLDDKGSQNDGNGSLGMGANSTNQQGFDYGKGYPVKEKSTQHSSSEILDSDSQTGGLFHGQGFVGTHLSNMTSVAYGSPVARLHQNDINRVWHGDSQAAAASVKDFEAFGGSLKPSNIPHQNYSVLNHVQARKNVETDLGKRVLKPYNGVDGDLEIQQGTTTAREPSLSCRNDTGVRNPMDDERNAASQINPFPSGDTKLSFLSEERKDKTVKDLSQSVLQGSPSQGTLTFGRSDSLNHTTSGSMASTRTENSQISLQMANSWFKLYGNYKNGQMLPMYGARAAEAAAAAQFSFIKPSDNVPMHTSAERGNFAEISPVTTIWPNTAANLVAKEHLSTPDILTLERTDQSLDIIRPKKRKNVPWHEEVMQGSTSLQDIRMAERDWAQATDRLIEKVKFEAELINDGHPMLRSKRRLILTTQLMQQLLRPAPAAILSADASSDYDSMAYFIAKIALSDACSLTFCPRRLVPSVNNNLMSEELKTSENTEDQYFSKILEGFTVRTETLEKDLMSLDKRTSMVDIRVECQELEKFSIVNRFAKLYTRGQADAAESSFSDSSAPTIFPQKYVNALPMPSRVPEGIQCLSL